MKKYHLLRGAALLLLGPALACTMARQTPMPAPTLDTLVFEVQTATPTATPVLLMASAPTHTPDPNATPTPLITGTLTATLTVTLTAAATNTPAPQAVEAPPPTAPPPPTATAVPAEPLQGGAWDFEDGFVVWANPYGDACPGSGLANGWASFTTRDQYGSACFNETVWKDNVHSGVSAQEITFAYVGIEAGVFRQTAAIPGHRYTLEAFMRREFSPSKVEVFVGVDLTGGVNWQADTVQWFPWAEDLDNAWSRTETTFTAAAETITIYLRGAHLYPEPGGTLRLDSIRIVDVGPE